MENRCKVIAVLDWPGWLEQHRRVYDPDYCSPTIHTAIGRTTQIKVLIYDEEMRTGMHAARPQRL